MKNLKPERNDDEKTPLNRHRHTHDDSLGSISGFVINLSSF
jgi:hypothetical protein